MSEGWAVDLFVRATPVTQGNHIVARHGKIIERRKAALVAFREAIAWEILRARRPAIAGPVEVHLAFALTRPKRPRYPIVPAGKPDLDKLTRAVLDALTSSGVIEDDARVVDLGASKRWAKTHAGVRIGIRPALVEASA